MIRMHALSSGPVVMVTGATGFIGSHLVRALVARGAGVIAVSRKNVEPSGGVLSWIRADLSDLAQANWAFEEARPDTVFHLSSLANGRPDLGLVEPTFRYELAATVNVLQAATQHKLRRLVLAGSLDEPAPGSQPASPYAAAKAASHVYADLFHSLYGVPLVIARIFMAYGPGQPSWKLIPP